MTSMPVELYTDGSTLDQQGKPPHASGLAYIIRYWDTPAGADMPSPTVIEFAQGYRNSTNNRMEIMAGIQGLQTILEKIQSGQWKGITQINLSSDSEYFCNSINQKWIEKWRSNGWMTAGFKNIQPKPVRNKDLWEIMLGIIEQLRNNGVTLTMIHIPGHSGHEFNEKCDDLAKAAAKDTVNHKIDQGYEQNRQPYGGNRQ